MTETAQVDSVALGLPRDWIDHPLDPKAFETSLAQQMERLRELGLSVAERRNIELLRRQIRDLLVTRRVVSLATVATMTQGQQQESRDGDDGATDDSSEASEDGDEAQQLIVAAVAVSIADRYEIGAPVPLDIGSLVRAMSTPDDDVLDLDPPARVDLEVGPAVRLARLHRVAVGDGATVESIVQSYIVPFERGEWLCTLQFVTPNIDVGGAFSSLFDAIADTLRIFREGERTDFVDPEVGRAR